MEVHENSFSSDNDTSRAIGHINDCITYDNMVPEFFSLLGSSEPIEYYRPIRPNDIFSLSSSAPFPDDIKPHYMCAEEIGICGCLPFINRYYYILDNKIFLWRMNGKNDLEQIMEQEKVITAVCTLRAAHDFFTKSVAHLLVVATPTYIKMYPMENDYINVSTFYSVKVNFTPTTVCEGDNSQLFIGGTDGQLYLFKFIDQAQNYFSSNSNQEPEQYVLTNLTASWLKIAILSFLSFAVTPISQICYDQTTNLLASIDNSQRINIYNFKDDSLSLNFSFSPPKGTNFVTIRNIPNSDSFHIRFVAFTEKGDRYFFGSTDTFIGKSTKIALRGQRAPPTELQGRTVIDAFYSLGYYAFVCKDYLVGILSLNVDETNCYELVSECKLSGFGLCISGLEHGLSWMETRMFHEPIISQHFVEVPPLFVLTSNGGTNLSFHPPAFSLSQQIANVNYQYSSDSDELMDRFAANDESCAMCLLLASMHPENDKKYLYVATVYSQLKMIHVDATPDILTPIAHAFYVRASRLLALIWNVPTFFGRADNSIKVSPAFTEMSPEFLHKLSYIIALGNIYLHEAEINSKQYDDHQLEVYDVEQGQIKALQICLEEIIEALRFIRILSKQKSLFLSVALDKIDKGVLDRLENQAFGSTEFKVNFMTALREFVQTLFRNMAVSPELTFLAAQLDTECPSLTKSAEAKITRALGDLEAASRASSDDEKEAILHRAANVFVEFANKEFDITRVCAAFIRLGADERAVSIAAARARYIDDPEIKRAYFWYRNGCSQDDPSGARTFDAVYRCYEAAFDAAYTEKGLDAIMKTKDELFALLVYQRMLNTDEKERLLRLKDPAVLDFLRENAPKLVWKYFVTQKNNKKAAKELIRLASDASYDKPEDEIPFAQRIEYLELAINYARKEGGRIGKLAEEATLRLSCARIQKEMSAGIVVGEPLKDLATLLDEAQEKKLWIQSLKIVSLMEVDDVDMRDIDIKVLWCTYLFKKDDNSNYNHSNDNNNINSITDEKEINTKVKSAFDYIGTDNVATQPTFLVPVFEDLRNSNGLRPEWVVDTLTRVGVDGAKLYLAYIDILQKFNPSEDDSDAYERKNQLVYAALWLIDHGYRGDIELIRTYITDKHNPYYKQIKQIMSEFE